MVSDAALESIYTEYPRKAGRKAKSLESIRKAIERICSGEIDGKPRAEEDAIVWLRGKVTEKAFELQMRVEEFRPHATTWFNQKRYLREPETVEMPEGWERVMEVVRQHPRPVPWMLASDASLGALLIRRILQSGENMVRHGASPSLAAFLDWLEGKTRLYAECVKEWPDGEKKYIVGAGRWYQEHRYLEEDESTWRRVGYGATEERKQIARIAEESGWIE